MVDGKKDDIHGNWAVWQILFAYVSAMRPGERIGLNSNSNSLLQKQVE